MTDDIPNPHIDDNGKIKTESCSSSIIGVKADATIQAKKYPNQN